MTLKVRVWRAHLEWFSDLATHFASIVFQPLFRGQNLFVSSNVYNRRHDVIIWRVMTLLIARSNAPSVHFFPQIYRIRLMSHIFSYQKMLAGYFHHSKLTRTRRVLPAYGVCHVYAYPKLFIYSVSVLTTDWFLPFLGISYLRRFMSWVDECGFVTWIRDTHIP